MRLQHVTLIKPFKSNAKPKLPQCSNVTFSTANTNGRWFIDNCSNPSDIVYLDEIKQREDEYFQIIYGEGGKKIFVPISDLIVKKNGILFVEDDEKIQSFTGVLYTKENNVIQKETHYYKGYPASLTEYKDGKEYRNIQYSIHNKGINRVYYFDGSLELSQTSDTRGKTVFLQTLNEYGGKRAVKFFASRNDRQSGFCKCEAPDDEGYRTVVLSWGYPEIEYSFSDDKEGAKMLKDELIRLRKAIRSDEFNKDFGRTGFFNGQLYDAIMYLSDLKDN